jgi:hypothetical protein
VSTGGGAQRRLLTELAVAGVDFVLIGGHAVAAHGYERATRDVDIVFSTDAESCERLATALAALGASIELADAPAPDGITAQWLAAGGHFRFATDAGPLDALSQASGRDYSSLASRAVSVTLGEAELAICSYEDLLELKRASGRPGDQVDLEALEAAHRDD